MEDQLPILRVFLLGSFRVELEQPDGTKMVIEDFDALLGRGLSATLFKLILCHPERRVKRDLLVRAMWPGQTLISVRKSLDVTKSLLGRTLEQLCGRPMLPRVNGDPPIYAIASQSELWTDLEACEQAIGQALATKDSAASLGYWERAYSFMQRGELLAEDTAAYWYKSPLIQDCCTRLSKQRMQCASRIADLSLECGEISRALEVLTQECEADPAHEGLAFHLMNVLARLSRYSEALARYTQLEAALEERGTVPREETKRLALWLRASVSTKRFSGSSEVAIRVLESVRPSSQEQRTDKVGIKAFLLPPVLYARPIDWGEAPQVKALYGREHELTTLSQWIVNGQVHLVAIIGMAGIGKTSLAVALIEQIHTTFHTIIWRSLQNALPLHTFLRQCIEMLTEGQQTDLPETLDEQISLLISHLRADRCLLVLDNLESLLQSGKRVGEYREGYEGYGRLITRIGESKHQSCLLLTSREKPKEVANLSESHSPVRAFCLQGLSADDGMQILRDKGVRGETDAQTALISFYTGNPLALKLVSQYIVEVFHGEITAFLRDGEVIFSDIQDVLDQQFERLSSLEQDILYWLAIEREAVPLHTLHENLVRPVSRKDLQDALRSASRRHLMESTDHGFVLQNVVMEYLTDRLISQICEEISTGSLVLFSSHALIKAQAKDYVRESQVHRILQPIGERLLVTFGREGCETILKRILSQSRSSNTQQSSYVAGNILNLLIQLGCDLRGYDFSSLEIRQAYLQGVVLANVNFSHGNLVTSVFTDTFGSVLSVTISPDGVLLAIGTANGEIRIWHNPSGTLLQICHGHTDWIRSVAFHPDGTILASGSEDQTIRLWEVQTGACRNILRGHRSWIRSVAFSPDGCTLASSGDDQTILLWEVSTGTLITRLEGHEQKVWSVIWSPDGTMLASGSEDQTVRIWEVRTGKLLKSLCDQTHLVYSVAWSPNGKVLASGSEDRIVRLWEVPTGSLLKKLQGHVKQIRSVAFSSDGELIASGSDDQTIRIWDTHTGHCKKILRGHTNLVWSVAFHPNNHILLSGSHDQTIRVWDADTGYCLKTLQGHTSWIRSVVFSPDGCLLASDGDGQTIRLWEEATGLRKKILRGHTNLIWSMTFSPDGHLLASGSEDQTVRLWDVPTGRLLKTLQGHSSWVRSVAFSPDGNRVASGSEDQTIRLWSVNTGQCEKILREHTNWVRSVAFRPDGQLLASGSDDQTVRLWDIHTGVCLTTLQGHRSMVWSVAFSPDGNTIASGSHDQTVRLWDVRTGQERMSLQEHTDWVWSVAFSPDGRLLASGSHDQTVRLWDVSTGACLKVLRGHTSWIWSVAFSPDGGTLVSGSDDGTIKLWDPQTGACLRTLKCERPYERMNITAIQGLTEIQKATLKALGAIEEEA